MRTRIPSFCLPSFCLPLLTALLPGLVAAGPARKERNRDEHDTRNRNYIERQA